MGRSQRAWTWGIGIPVLVMAAPVPAQEPAPGGADVVDTDPLQAPNPKVAMKVSVEGEGGRETQLGTITIELFPAAAPEHVANFLKLTDEGFYEGVAFHRIVPGFVVQGGDPASKADWTSPRLGLGVDDCRIPAEIAEKHTLGAVAAARKPDEVNPSRSSSCHQFYICLADLPSLDRGNYTVFGKVVNGMDVVEKISRVKNAGSEHWHRALQRVYITGVERVK